MKKLFMKRSHDLDTGHAETCSEVGNSTPAGVRGSNRVSQWAFRMVAILAILFNGSVASFAQSLKYVGSIPENNSSITSLARLTLEFDLTEVYQELGGNVNDWGICCNTYYNTKYPDRERTVTLYEGNIDDNVVLKRLATTIKPPSELFTIGNTIEFDFSDIEIKAGTQYNVVIKYAFFAGKVGDTTWTSSTQLDYQLDPLVLTFYGAAETTRVLKYEGSNINENQQYEKLSIVQLSFNYDIALNDVSQTSSSILENGQVLEESQSMCVDPEDAKSLIISFPETILYKYELKIN